MDDMSEPMDLKVDRVDPQPMDLCVRKKTSFSPSPRPSVVVMKQSSVLASEPLDYRCKPLLAVPPLAAVKPTAAVVAVNSSSHPPQPLPFVEAIGPFGPPSPLPPSLPTERAERQFQQQRQLGELDTVLDHHQRHLEEQERRIQWQMTFCQQYMESHEDVDGHALLNNLDPMFLAQRFAAAFNPPLTAATLNSSAFPFAVAAAAASFSCVHHHHRRSAGADYGYDNNSNSSSNNSIINSNNNNNNNNSYPYSSGGQESSAVSFGSSAFVGVGGVGGLGSTGGQDDDSDDENVDDIYKTPEYLEFRQRYLDSLGPPRNYEKMRRSAPASKQPYALDESYAQKRIKNNEAAKKSRDAKRQKFLENQISVMYLTKKIREMNELKRRLLMNMT